MPRRRADKIDENQRNIVSSLRLFPGVTVETGHDDVLVGYQKRTFWFEIKSSEALSKKTGEVLPSKIKPSQYRLLASWKGHYAIVSSLDEILKEIGLK